MLQEFNTLLNFNVILIYFDLLLFYVVFITYNDEKFKA